MQKLFPPIWIIWIHMYTYICVYTHHTHVQFQFPLSAGIKNRKNRLACHSSLDLPSASDVVNPLRHIGTKCSQSN